MNIFGDKIILVPTQPLDTFAVVACDQFTSEPEYWHEIESSVADKPSVLNLILPEIYLDGDTALRVANIAPLSKEYADKYYKEAGRAVLTVRKTVYGRMRYGLVLTIDLKAYDFDPSANAPIRASERTIRERALRRIPVVETSALQLSHVLLLIDDPDNLAFSAALDTKGEVLYRGGLNGKGGSVTGYAVDGDRVIAALEEVYARTSAREKTDLFAIVGDGNHSLACLKEIYNKTQSENDRFALVEIENVYDEGLVCRPINRLVSVKNREEFFYELSRGVAGAGKLYVLKGNEDLPLRVPSDKVECLNAIDEFCEKYVSENGGSIDYVHGTDAFDAKAESVLIKMPQIEKSELFPLVVKHGMLPKKSFSLGEGSEKRYYIEALKVK